MIGPNSCPLPPIEGFLAMIQDFTQLAIRTRPSCVNELVQEIGHKAMGCRTAVRNGQIVSDTSDPIIKKIPDTFKNLKDEIDFVVQKCTPSLEDRCAIICYNNDSVVLNTSHITADGAYLQWLNKYLLGNEICHDPYWKIPEFLQETFKEEIESATPFADNKILSLKSDRYDSSLELSQCKFKKIEIPFSEFNNYSQGKLSNMTERIFNSVIMPVSAYNGKFTIASTRGCINLRNLIPGKAASWKNTNLFSNKTVHAKDVTENSTIGEVGRKFRSYLQDSIRNRTFINEIKASLCPSPQEPQEPPAMGTGFSNIGEFWTGGIIEDIDVGTSFRYWPQYRGDFMLTTYNVGERFVCLAAYHPAVLTEAEADKLANQVRFVLTKADNGTVVKDLVDELKMLD